MRGAWRATVSAEDQPALVDVYNRASGDPLDQLLIRARRAAWRISIGAGYS